MKNIPFAALIALAPSILLGSEPSWIFETSSPTVTRQVDWRLASKIETAGGGVRLLKERDGKLVTYFESTNVDTAKQVLAQMGYADAAEAPTHIPVGGGAYVSLEHVASVEYQKAGDVEICILRGCSMEIGRVSDAPTIKRVKAKLKR